MKNILFALMPFFICVSNALANDQFQALVGNYSRIGDDAACATKLEVYSLNATDFKGNSYQILNIFAKDHSFHFTFATLHIDHGAIASCEYSTIFGCGDETTTSKSLSAGFSEVIRKNKKVYRSSNILQTNGQDGSKEIIITSQDFYYKNFINCSFKEDIQ